MSLSEHYIRNLMLGVPRDTANGLVSPNGLPTLPTYRVKSGKGDAEIMAAQAWIMARFEFGVIELDPFGSYTIGDTVSLETGVVNLKGNRAKLNAPALAAGKVALLLTNTQNGDGPREQFPFTSEVSDVYIDGDSVTNRDYDAIAIRAHTDMNTSSVRTTLNRVRYKNFAKGISIGSRAYFLHGFDVSGGGCGIALLQEAGATDYSENVVFNSSAFYNSDCLVRTLGGQKIRLYGTSLDYFGDQTGSRQTANDYALDIQAGGLVECHGVHIEFIYGKVAGQTHSPIRLTGANSRFIMHGGLIGTPDAVRQPLYETPIASDNGSQVVVLRDVTLLNMGRSGQPTKDDQLVGGSAASNTGGVIAQVFVENLIPHNFSLNDLPSCVGYTSGPNLLRQGVDAPHTELAMRITTTGTAAVSSVGTTDGAVTARNSTGNMLKITGAGKVTITLPSLRADRRTGWSLFINSSQAVGSMTVKQRDCTAVWKWDGASAVTGSQDTRNSYSSATKTITAGSTNQFERVGYKDVHADCNWSPRMGGPVFGIEIDTTSITSGAIYVDDVALGQM